MVIVTGAASGLGRETALRLAREGAALVLVDVDEAALRSLKAGIGSIDASQKAVAVVADVSKEKDVHRYVQKAVKTFGRIDGFFNNAGTEGRRNPTSASATCRKWPRWHASCCRRRRPLSTAP